MVCNPYNGYYLVIKKKNEVHVKKALKLYFKWVNFLIHYASYSPIRCLNKAVSRKRNIVAL